MINVFPLINQLLSIFLILFIVGCQSKTSKNPTAKSFQKVKISILDQSRDKSIPQATVRIDSIDIPFQKITTSSSPFTITLETGIHDLAIFNQDTIYYNDSVKVILNKDLLWIIYDNAPSLKDYQNHFAYSKLLDTLMITSPLLKENFQKDKIELLLKGTISDSVIQQHHGIYQHIVTRIKSNNSLLNTNNKTNSGFNILYHQTMRI